MSVHKVVSLVVVVTLTIAFVWASFWTAPVASSADPGTIAYVQRSTYDIHVIAPDGSGDRVLWTAPHPLGPWAADDLAWRPDGGELAFSSEHEVACSWYQSDVYAIRYNGGGYRRVTNAPACALLAGLPKGSVTVQVTNGTNSLVQAYVAGAPEPQSIPPYSYGTVTFHNVADFGPGVPQPSVGIYGLYRFMQSAPIADVQPNKTVAGGYLNFSNTRIYAFGAGKVSWKADGSALAYGMRTSSGIDQIPANPPYGSIGVPLPVVENASPHLVAWGPTDATKDQYLYSSDNPINEDAAGIYLNTVGDTSGGTKLVNVHPLDAEVVWDIEWLPDASGFLFTFQWFAYEPVIGAISEIWEYKFGDPPVITKLTNLGDASARELSISPDGQQVVFERVDDDDSTSSLSILDLDDLDVNHLIDDAGRPAWGQTPAPLTPRAYLPVVMR